MTFGAILGSFGVQVGGCGGPSWRFGSLFGVYVGSCNSQGGSVRGGLGGKGGGGARARGVGRGAAGN